MEKCICVIAPMGDSGLEGFEEHNNYQFEFMEKDKNGHTYYRVYFNDDVKDNTGYYQTCGVNTFKKFFKTKEL